VIIDESGLIAQSCPAPGEPVASFKLIITGRGGLPPNPTEPLTGDNVLTDWATLDSEFENRPDVENRSSAAPATNSTTGSVPTQIVEATGWIVNNKSEVILTAAAPTATLDIPWLPDSDCHPPESPS
jgi:large exoprotein involved in heme utilization and adhesion